MANLKTKLLVFLTAFGICFLIFHAIVRLQVARQTNVFIQEINTIHDKIEDRFKLIIDAPLAVGIATSSYMASHYKDQEAYEMMSQKILSVFDELLGLTILDADGKIVRVFPLKDNPSALGKKSQNTDFLKEAYQANQSYWLSPPFTLYQGPSGFAFYVPMVEGAQLKGWIAPIISLERFFNKFIKVEFLKNYHLIIQDVQTSKNYFASSSMPENDNEIQTHLSLIRGRNMRFISWRKEKSYSDHAHWPFSAFLSFVIAFIATYTYWLFEQKSQARKQLSDVDTLLSITTRDTAASLDAIQHQLALLKQGSGPVAVDKISLHVSTIATMVQQITVLQRISTPDGLPILHPTDVKPLIKEISETYALTLKMRDLVLLGPEDQTPVIIRCNKWLICHSVLGNLLVYAMEKANTDSTIRISCVEENKQIKITLAFKGQPFTPEVLKGYLEHGLYVAQKVVQIHKGNILFANHVEGEHVMMINFKV